MKIFEVIFRGKTYIYFFEGTESEFNTFIYKKLDSDGDYGIQYYQLDFPQSGEFFKIKQ